MGRLLRRIALGGALVVGAAVGAGLVLSAAMARRITRPTWENEEQLPILAVDPEAGLVTLGDRSEALVPGRYSLWFAGGTGHARVGEIVGTGPGSVTRQLLGIDRGDLLAARRGRLGSWFYLTPADLELPFEEVLIPTPVGDAPAWLVPAKTSTGSWAILVHGRGVTRQETLRSVPTFRRAGYDVLMISWRNDGVAPPSPDGRLALGAREWRDLEAAMHYALEQGATDLVLAGWSTGGQLILQALAQSPDAAKVRGAVLDSPVIAWRSVLEAAGKESSLPLPVRAGAYGLVEHPLGRAFTGLDQPIDLDRLDMVQRAGEITVPVLILQSEDDDVVPSGPAHELAALRPDLVTLDSWTIARHVRLWNVDSARWDKTVAAWLKRLR